MLWAMKSESEKDYKDMRNFQEKFIIADKEIEKLRAENASLEDQLQHCSDAYQDLGLLIGKDEAELAKLRAANGVLWKTLDQIDWHIRGLQNEKILTMKEMGIALKVISDGLTGLKGILNDTTN